MNYELLYPPTLAASECLVLGVFNDLGQSAFVKELDRKHDGVLSRLHKKLEEKGNWIWQGEIEHHSLMLIHCGKESEFNEEDLAKRLKEITQVLIQQRVVSATICLPLANHQTPARQLEQIVLQLDHHLYEFLEFKTLCKKPHRLETIRLSIPAMGLDEDVSKQCQAALQSAEAVAAGVRYTRSLADLPANVCTPTYLSERALELAKEHSKIKVKVFDLKAIQSMKMGSFLAVAQGSKEEPRFIELQYRGNGNAAPIVLVGKGITFDSGGISIKPANAMEEMKYDMSGAASVLGVLKACALLKLPLNVVGVIASAENMPSGEAVKPGDIVTSMSGQTIEVLNTDAEGRLILADALTYAERFNPEFVIDIATLTGAMVISLGHLMTGFMTEDPQLADQLYNAGQKSRDLTWRFPLHDAYQEGLESPIADVANISSDRGAGSIVGACFLARFTKKYRWAHLDIAGTAWISGKKRHATGRPVPVLTQLLRDAAANPR